MKHHRIVYAFLIIGLNCNCFLEATFKHIILSYLNQSKPEQPISLTDHQQEQLDTITDHLDTIIARLPDTTGTVTALSEGYEEETSNEEENFHPYGEPIDLSLSIEELIISTYAGFRSLVQTVITYLQQ